MWAEVLWEMVTKGYVDLFDFFIDLFNCNLFSQPLSEVSIESSDRKNVMLNSMVNPASNSLSRFHRSLSMGQGWPALRLGNKFLPNNSDINQLCGGGGGYVGGSSKVILRRRNNSTCEG